MKHLFITLSIFILSFTAFSQGGVAVNTSGNNPDASAMLDVSSNSKGVLIPRVALTASNLAAPVVAPIASLLVYNTATAGTVPNDVVPGFYYWDGTKWVKIVSGNVVGTDDQNLTGASLTGSVLQIDIESGTSATVDLAPLVASAGTDDQNLTSAVLTGTSLTINIENGTPVTVDLSTLLNDADSDPLNEMNTGVTVAGGNLNVIDANSTQSVPLSQINANDWHTDGNAGTTPAANFLGTTDAQDLVIRTNNTEKMRVTSTGNVGIGSSIPRAFLDVTDISTDTLKSVLARLPEANTIGKGTYLGVFSHNSAPAPTNSFSIQHRFFDKQNASINFLRGFTDDDGSLSITTRGNMERIRFDVDGNIGINTTTPANKLEVTHGTVGNSGIRMTNFPNEAALATNATGDIVAATPAPTNGAFWGLTGNSGTNTATNFLGTTDAQDLVVRTNNTEKLRIQSGGNVGVGVSVPTHPLTIRSGIGNSIRFGSFSYLGEGAAGYPYFSFDMDYDGTNWIGIHPIASGRVLRGTSNNDFRFSFVPPSSSVANPLDVMTIISDGSTFGNVGIGTTLPSNKLHVEGTGSRFENSLVGGSHTMLLASDFNTHILVQDNTNTVQAELQAEDNIGSVGTETNHDFKIVANNTEAIRVRTNGNVGIGTAAPSRRLHVQGFGLVTSPSGAHFTIANDAISAYAEFQINNSTLEFVNPGNVFNINRFSPSNLYINAGGGNVNIGDPTFPGAKLQVSNGNSSDTEQRIANFIRYRIDGAAPSALMVGTLGFVTSTSAGSQRAVGALKFGSENNQTNETTDRDGYLAFHTVEDASLQNSGGAERLRITSNGNVGIGTTAPTQKLHVIGNILASGTITPSDARYKTNITTLTNSLDNVLNMRGVSYEMKEEFKDKGFGMGTQIGVIAQEIEKIYPELVNTSADGYKGVDYSKFTPILIEAIKEQQAQIELLKAENKMYKSESASKKEMESANSNLQAQIDQLKSLLLQTTNK